MAALRVALIIFSGCAWLISNASLGCADEAADDRFSTPERQFDNRIVALMMDKATVVLVGEPIYPFYYKKKGALNARLPFQVKVHRILWSKPEVNARPPISTNQARITPLELAVKPNETIKVGVTRDDVDFRFKEGEPAVFFLKPDLNRYKPESTNRLYLAEWRTVSDYFAVQPYSLALERMIAELKGQK